VSFEILSFDHTSSEKGICEIYNAGIAKAKYNTLCFMHEDITLLTSGWGQVIESYFQQNARLGVVWVAGTTFKSVFPIGWPSLGLPVSERNNLIQSYKYTARETKVVSINPYNEQLAKVAVVDGVWMCVRKEVVSHVRFDSDTFNHFHCYDIDFCLAAGQHYEIAVTFDILLHHFSEGRFDRRWMEESLLLYKKWETVLPRSVVPLSTNQIKRIEKQNFRYWLQLIHRLGFEKSLAFWLLHRPRIRRLLGWKYYLKFHYSILNEYFFRKPSRS
ncbi:MAG TPA: glycosyltransferase, partial [Flavisolibacter sp.]|nr:glycosyltransferase [Flavisolibacter sp.]